MTFWIFQGNPDLFDIDTYLREYNPIRWRVAQHRDKIRVNDVVFIWRAKGRERSESGIIAKGIILTRPAEMEDDAPHLWKDPAQRGKRIPRVVIEVLETRLTREEGMIPAKLLEEIFPDLEIFKWRQATNYRLKPEQGHFINSLWEALIPKDK